MSLVETKKSIISLPVQTFSRVLDLHSTIADHTKNRCLGFSCVYVDGRLCQRNILEEGLAITGLFWLCKCKKCHSCKQISILHFKPSLTTM